MSDQLEHTVPEPIADPGLPAHAPRLTDVDPAQEKRAERQVATFFGLSALFSILFCIFYFTVGADASFLGFHGQNLALGGTLGFALLTTGLGVIHYTRKLVGDHEIAEDRHRSDSAPADVEETLAKLNTGIEETGIARRPLIRFSLLGAVGAMGLPGIVLLRDLGPLPEGVQAETVWGMRKTMRVVNDVTGAPIKPSDLQVGQLVNAEPGILFETNAEGEPVIEGAEKIAAKAKAAVIVVRMRPEDIKPSKRDNWGIDGILCFSKICTHVGCPISLWEQQTHHLLCPCHQSTFDLADGGKVIFGPAHRALPQLKLDVDAEGYLVALGDFEDIVGPSYPELAGEQADKDKA